MALFQKKGAARYSRSGRLLKPMYEWDESLNRAVAFNVETDTRVLVILEAKRDIVSCVFITFTGFVDHLLKLILMIVFT